MSSTNSTTNYGLSQFISTDCPAWLGDYNQDMAKIDTQMKNNATGVASATSSISTQTQQITALTTSVGQATADASEALSKANTATSNVATLSTAVTGISNQVQTNSQGIATNTSDINTLKVDVEELQLELIPTQESSISGTGCITGLETYSLTELKLVQSPKSTTYKFYGRLDIYHGSGAYSYTRTAVTGLSGVYGFKTALKLNFAPDESYVVTGAGVVSRYTPSASGSVSEVTIDSRFAVDNEGYIWVDVSTAQSDSVTSYGRKVHFYNACLYFNSNFGDTPVDPSA